MIRLASVLGVAAVATMVLLSGCDMKKTADYAKDLQGTWQHGPAEAMTANPVGTVPPTIPVTRTITVEITREDVNKGMFSLTVSDKAKAPYNVGPLTMALATTAKGTFDVDSSEMTVDIKEIKAPLNLTLPPAVEALKELPQKLGYELNDAKDKLDVSGAVLVGLGVTATKDEKFKLDKQ